MRAKTSLYLILAIYFIFAAGVASSEDAPSAFDGWFMRRAGESLRITTRLMDHLTEQNGIVIPPAPADHPNNPFLDIMVDSKSFGVVYDALPGPMMDLSIETQEFDRDSFNRLVAEYAHEFGTKGSFPQAFSQSETGYFHARIEGEMLELAAGFLLHKRHVKIHIFTAHQNNTEFVGECVNYMMKWYDAVLEATGTIDTLSKNPPSFQ